MLTKKKGSMFLENKMKGLHISDIHGDLEALDAVRKFSQERKDLEVVVCSGDLIGTPLSDTSSKKMREKFGFILNSIETNGPVPIEKIFELIGQDPNAPQELKEAVKVYKEAEGSFDIYAKRSYEEIASLFSQFPQTILTIPGNWDSKQYFKYMKKFDIHKKTVEINDVEFGGYGGADVIPIFLPPTRIVPYDEDELFNFLTENSPEIAVTHMPPRGILDRNGKGNIGSWANLAYIRNPEDSSNLMLCGHCHESVGATKPENLTTLVINPGNFGTCVNAPAKRCFFEIDYRNGRGTSVKPYKVENGEVREIKL